MLQLEYSVIVFALLSYNEQSAEETAELLQLISKLNGKIADYNNCIKKKI